MYELGKIFLLLCQHCCFSQLLRVGLKDLSAMVVEACVNGLLRSWSLECHDGNFIALLSRLYVESAPDVSPLWFYLSLTSP